MILLLRTDYGTELASELAKAHQRKKPFKFGKTFFRIQKVQFGKCVKVQLKSCVRSAAKCV